MVIEPLLDSVTSKLPLLTAIESTIAEGDSVRFIPPTVIIASPPAFKVTSLRASACSGPSSDSAVATRIVL